ncbi:P-loop containing nucleoside triphosphate hydrolase protein [Camillea tinctor]|nr:P-loop containing nucleoside triphosphate hydrolase protein [Camillea tinctor]
MFSVLTASHDRRTVAIHGPNGIGKTRLAIEFAKRYHTDYSAVIWLKATNETTLKQSLVKTAERILWEHPSVRYLKNAVVNRNVDDIIKAVKRWLNEPSNKYWLIICDNYEYPQLNSNTASIDNNDDTEYSDHSQGLIPKSFHVHDFLPESCHGAIIITTQSSLFEVDQTIKLRKFESIEDSLQLLESVSKRRSLRQDPAAVELSKKLGGLSFALKKKVAYN